MTTDREALVEAMTLAAYAVATDPNTPGPNIPINTAQERADIIECTRLMIEAALEAHDRLAAPAVPEGFVMVPREALEPFLRAARGLPTNWIDAHTAASVSADSSYRGTCVVLTAGDFRALLTAADPQAGAGNGGEP